MSEKQLPIDPTKLDVRGGWTSASNAQADQLCPGRHLAQAQIPERDGKDRDTDSGNRLHLALLRRDPAGLQGDEIERFGAAMMLEDALVLEFFAPSMAERARKKVWREQRFWTKVQDPLSGRWLQHSGQPDVVYRNGTKALIIEYKGLYGEIPPAPENEQLRDQAILVRGNFITIDEIGVAVIQPAVTHESQICYYNLEQLKVAETLMFQRVCKSNDPNSPRIAGERQCKFCRAKAQCGEYNQFAGSLVPGMVALLQVRPIDWTPQQRAEFLAKRGIAQRWLDDTVDDIKNILEKDPDAAPGFKLRPGNVKETIINPQVTFERFVQLGGTAEQFMPCVAVGKRKLQEAVRVVTGARGKSLAETFDKVNEGNIARSVAAPTIVATEEPAP